MPTLLPAEVRRLPPKTAKFATGSACPRICFTNTGFAPCKFHNDIVLSAELVINPSIPYQSIFFVNLNYFDPFISFIYFLLLKGNEK